MQKKMLLVLLSVVMIISMLFGISACSTDNTVKYTYTNSQGETSYFEIDFDKEEYTYSGNAWYRQGLGYMLWPNTNYSVSSSIYYSHAVNGYKVYHFHNLPICYKKHH